jgi:hypothetical protein
MLALLAAMAAVAVCPAYGYPASAHAAKTKHPRCPLKGHPKQRCPKAADIVRTHSNGTVGRSEALKAFAATIAPLPGVKPPKHGYPFITSGSGPIRWVLGQWSKLTPAQQAAVQKALPGIALPGAASTAGSPPRSVPHPRARTAANLSLAELQELVEKARDKLNAHFNPDLTLPLAVQLGNPPSNQLDAYAYVPQQKGPCIITFTPNGQAHSLEEGRMIMLHELTHCWQNQLNPFPGKAPTWLVEGSATWVQAVVGREWNGKSYAWSDIKGWWKIYFASFKTPLTAQSYSAMPFFAHLAHSGADVFSALAAAFASPDPANTAYDIFVDAGVQGGKFKTTTAPAGTRLADLGDDWVAYGPMLPDADEARYNPPTLSLGSSSESIKAKAYGHTVVGLSPKSAAEVVKLKVDTTVIAWGLLHHAAGDVKLQEADGLSFCARQKCICPNGSKFQPLGDQSYLALYGQKDEAEVTLKPEKLKDACKAKTKVTVTGASNMSFTKAFCVLGSNQLRVELPWSEGNVKQGHVTLEINGYTGKGTYKTGPSLATVDDFRPFTMGSWNLAQSGTITVGSPGLTGGYGAAGTVNTVSYRKDPYSSVLVSGEWSC